MGGLIFDSYSSDQCWLVQVANMVDRRTGESAHRSVRFLAIPQRACLEDALAVIQN